MIATKPKTSSTTVEAAFEPAETAPLLDYGSPTQPAALPESLFYGLSFPEVPTDVPTIAPPARSAGVPTKTWKPLETVEEKPVAGSRQERVVSVTKQATQERDISADLSALYTSMEAPVEHVYPSLPSLALATHRQQPASVAHEQVETDDRVYHQSKTTAQSDPGAERLVQELLEENAKLAREVDDLRASLRVITEENSLETEMSRTARARSETTSSSESEVEPTTVRSDVTAAAPSAVDSTNGRLKYVCCGSCNQWLQAPIDKTYVYCPQCGSVNDCSSAERRNGQQAEVPAPRRLASAPWYQQCFVRLSQLTS